MEMLSFKEIELLNLKEKKEYLKNLRKYCMDIKYNVHFKPCFKKIIANEFFDD